MATDTSNMVNETSNMVNETVNVFNATTNMTESTSDGLTPSWTGATTELESIISTAMPSGPRMDLLYTPWDVLDYTFDAYSYEFLILGYIWSGIIAFGLVSNAFVLAMAVRETRATSSHGVILSFVASIDGFLLLLKICSVYHLIGNFYAIMMFHDAIWVCILKAVEQCSECMSAWFLVLLAADRIISICFPLQRLDWCTAKRGLISVGTISLISFALYLPHSIIGLINHGSAKWVVEPVTGLCTCLSNLYYKLFYVHLAIVHWIPILLLGVSIGALSRTLHSRIKKAKLFKVSEGLEVVLNRIHHNNRITVSFMSIFVKYIICQVPRNAYRLWFYISYQTRPMNVSYQTRPMNVTVPGTTDAPENRSVINVTAPVTVTNAPESEAPVPQETQHYAHLLFTAEIFDTLALLSLSCLLVTLLSTSDYFRRLLYMVCCPNRVNIDADFTSEGMSRIIAVNNRLDPLAKTHRRPVIATKVNSGLSSFKPALSHPATPLGYDDLKMVFGKPTKSHSPRYSLGDLNIDVTLTEQSIKEFELEHEQVHPVESLESVESVLQYTAEKLTKLKTQGKLGLPEAQEKLSELQVPGTNSDLQGHIASISRNVRL